MLKRYFWIIQNHMLMIVVNVSISLIIRFESEILRWKKVIMDADKIDILNNAVSRDISLDIGDDEVSPLVYENMFDHKILDMKKKSTKADRLCVWLAFVYGMHFDYSYKYLKDERIMSKLIEVYKNKTSNVVTKKQYEQIENDINLYLGGKYVG